MTATITRKKTTYADYVKIDDNKRYEVFVLRNGAYQEFCKARKRGVVKSKILAGLEVDLSEVFE